MSLKHSFFATVLLLTSASGLLAQADIKGTKDILNEWVNTRQILSKEKADWEVERELMASTKALLQSDIASVKEKIANLETTNTEEDRRKRELELQGIEIEQNEALVKARVAEMEASIKALVKTFPKPLFDRIEPVLSRIPEDPATTTANTGARLANVSFIIGQADKFNSTVTLASETREVSGGKVQVSVIYWGLASAYYVDADATIAGIGTPGPEGWTWTNQPEMAANFLQLVRLYEQTAEPAFVSLPISVK